MRSLFVPFLPAPEEPEFEVLATLLVSVRQMHCLNQSDIQMRFLKAIYQKSYLTLSFSLRFKDSFNCLQDCNKGSSLDVGSEVQHIALQLPSRKKLLFCESQCCDKGLQVQ